jgi:uncharacterized protein (DUF433 family)
MPTPTRTLRLRPGLRAEIERIARRARKSFSEVAQDLMEEAVRMRECPGVYFADEPAGRDAKVAGTGLGVWEVIASLKTARGNTKKWRAWHPSLSDAQARAALLYYERYPHEIDAVIAENEALYEAGRMPRVKTARRR